MDRPAGPRAAAVRVQGRPRPTLNETALYLITGPSSAGKTTVARLLAKRLEPAAHVEGDVFRRSVVSGRHDMTPTASDEAVAQLHLRYRLAATVADMYFAAGFNVVVEDVVAGPVLADVVGWIESRPLHVVVLLPSAEAIAERDDARDGTSYVGWDIGRLHAAFVDGTPRLGLWLDTTEHAPDDTVEAILAGRERAIV